MWLLGNNLYRVFHPLLIKTFSCFFAPRGHCLLSRACTCVCCMGVNFCVKPEKDIRCAAPSLGNLSFLRQGLSQNMFFCLFVFSLGLGWLSSNMLSLSLLYRSCKLSQSFQAFSGCWGFEFRSQLQQVLITTRHFAVFLKSFSNRCPLTPLQ